MRVQTLVRAIAVAAVSLSAVSSFASAEDKWPSKSIRIVVPAPPGGISDNVARLVGEQLRINLGQTVIIDNKPGGSAVIAERALMSAPTDGYTIMVAPSSVYTDFPLTVKTPFNPFETFTYLSDVATMVHVLVANKDFPPTKAQDIASYAKNNPKKVSVANMSTGTRSNLLGDLLSEKSARNITVVPYKGSSPALVDLIGNQVQLAFEVVGNVTSMIKAEKIKPFAIVSATRSPHLPDVPSFAELGMQDFVMPDASVGVMVLSSMPAPMQARIRTEIEKIKASPKFRDAMVAQGLDATKPMSQQELQQQVKSTIEQNRRILAKLKIATLN